MGKSVTALLSFLLYIAMIFPAQAGISTSATSIAACRKTAPSLEMKLARMGLEFGSPIFIRIFKESNELELWVQDEDSYKLFKTYEICCSSGKLGPKLREGDEQSPEGFYYVSGSQLNPFSRFHLSFNIGYPNSYDKAHGRTGSALMVHGDCVSVGCFAMTDPLVEKIYTMAEAALKNGQPFFKVHIFPFRMTAKNIKRHEDSRWIQFWTNLKEGYDHFEEAGIPPSTTVRSKKYIFNSPCEKTARNDVASKKNFN